MDHQERMHWTRFHDNHDSDSLEWLANRYDGLAISLAKFHSTRVSWLDFDEVCQRCRIGLRQAMKKFNPDLGYKFSTYARKFVRGEIYRDSEGRGGLTRKNTCNFKKVCQATERLMQTLRREPTDVEIAAACGLSEAEVKHTLNNYAMTSTDSIENYIELEDGDAGTGETLSLASSCPPVEDEVISREEVAWLDSALARLKVTDRQVIIMYYYDFLSDREIALKLAEISDNMPANPDELKRACDRVKHQRERAEQKLEKIAREKSAS